MAAYHHGSCPRYLNAKSEGSPLQEDYINFCGLNCIFLFLGPLRYKQFSGNKLVKSFEKSLHNPQGLWVQWRMKGNRNPGGPVRANIMSWSKQEGDLERSFTEMRNILHYQVCILYRPHDHHNHVDAHSKKRRKIQKEHGERPGNVTKKNKFMRK